MSVQTLAYQCTSCVVNNITSDALKLPHIPAELCQEIITFILRDRRLKRKDVNYLSVYWNTILTKLFEASNSPLFLDFSSSTINSDHLRIIGELCPILTGLNLNRNKLLSSDSISRLGNLPSLTYLNLSYCPLVDNNCLITLSKKEFNLSSLALEKCDITDAGITAIAAAFPNLTSLILAHCSQISDASVGVLADKCPKLEVLNLKNCKRVSDKSISKVLSQLSSLHRINLENCQRLTDNAFTNFACPLLAHLNLNFCDRVTTKSLLRIVDTAKLETVRVQQIAIKEETKGEMAEFIKKCPNAKKLNMVGSPFSVAPEILEKIGGCMDVKSLSLGVWTHDPAHHGGNTLTPEVLEAVFSNLGELEKLLFASIPVTAEIMSAVAKYCPLMTHINLRLCTSFNDAALSVISNGFPYLDRLTIYSSATITNEAIAELCSKCPRLSELKLIGCNLISDSSVVAIAKLKNLQRLILSDSHITNEAIKHIVTCVELRELDLSGCARLTPPCVALLTAPQSPQGGLKKLERLSCMLWMTDEHVVMLIEAFPLLNLLFLSGCPNIKGKSVVVKDMDLVVYLDHKDLKMPTNE